MELLDLPQADQPRSAQGHLDGRRAPRRRWRASAWRGPGDPGAAPPTVKALDPRLLRHAGATRGYLAATVAIGVAEAGCVVVQALLLASVVTRVFLGGGGLPEVRGALGGLLVALVLRAGLAWAGPVVAHR